MTFLRATAMTALALTVIGCSTTHVPVNTATTSIDMETGYRRLQDAKLAFSGDAAVLLAFSGGGTRAAALSYGVLEELRDTVIGDGEEPLRLLDEVDSISSVSGGSFTAAYYGAYRDKIFDDYEAEFLNLGVQQTLIRRLLNPANLFRGMFSGFDRTEMAVDYYDRQIFKGATFGDMARQGPPYIEINATDLSNGLRFTFNQERFDLICSDLSDFPLARAVTASSAVPVMFPTVTLKNHADQCELEESDAWKFLLQAEESADSASQKQLAAGLKSYRDVEKRPYVHLVDGGIADNLGLRTITERFEVLNSVGIAQTMERVPRSILIVLVNAEVKPEKSIDSSAKKPSVSDTMSAYTSAQMDRYNQETLDALREGADEFEKQAAALGTPTRVYFAEVGFKLAKNAQVNSFFNSLPTSLQLEEMEVDRLIGAGRMLLRHEPSFRAFKKNHNARLVADAVSNDEICQLFGIEECLQVFE
ncbi:MAG: patatin-like phospholipase family protein [Halioglobus sp.]